MVPETYDANKHGFCEKSWCRFALFCNNKYAPHPELGQTCMHTWGIRVHNNPHPCRQNIPKWKKKRMILEQLQKEHDTETMTITSEFLDPTSKAARKKVGPSSLTPATLMSPSGAGNVVRIGVTELKCVVL